MTAPEQFDAKSARTRQPMPLWAGAFDRATKEQGPEVIGAYMLILMAMWEAKSCDLPDDEKHIAWVAKVSPIVWRRKYAPIIMPMLSQKNSRILSEKLQENAEKTEEYCRKQHARKAGKFEPKPLKENDRMATTDISADKSTVNPPDQPLPLTINHREEGSELDKSNPPPSSAVAEIVNDQFLAMLAKAVGYAETPPNWRTNTSRGVIAGWFGSGLKQIEVLRRAKASRSVHPEPPATVQALASFMGPSTRRAAAEPPASEADVVAFWVKTLNGGGYIAPSAFGPQMARAILATGLVDEERLKSRGIAF